MRLPPPPALHQPVLSFVAALSIATCPLTTFPALAATPTTDELQKLSAGLARVDYLLDNWDSLTTACTGVSAGGELEDAQVMRTQGQTRCFKTPLKVQKYIGASSTLDPLFKADKLMIRAQPLVPDDDSEAYADAVDSYITKQQISSTMAYTSSWSGIENPNGSVGQIEDNLLEAKKEVIATRDSLRTVVQLLKLPSAPAFRE
ncbi:hypothetical protein AB1Y20_017973 [Prymnesium parvum]|uniref:Chorismate mutase n=1 Tax=Prymnesium parvum TaxID=97485 RepID=A0AB34JM52_PRYPA|mmetsp:Transcript_383/g.1079  ORF Transcript_383/g.1079 Transcript_383/m.1079 type:complete len:203 (-) Transcript_383:225-833(-)